VKEIFEKTAREMRAVPFRTLSDAHEMRA